jgi:hypothetical protein
MVLLPGHPNDSIPASLWEIQFNYFSATPQNKEPTIERAGSTTNTIKTFFWGHRIHTIDPIKILPLLRKSWSPTFKSQKDASILSFNTFLSQSHGGMRKEKASSGSSFSNNDHFMESFDVASIDCSHVKRFFFKLSLF